MRTSLSERTTPAFWVVNPRDERLGVRVKDIACSAFGDEDDRFWRRLEPHTPRRLAFTNFVRRHVLEIVLDPNANSQRSILAAR